MIFFLFKHQFGFKQNLSTVHTLCSIYHQLIKNADTSLYSCCIFLNSTKAIDLVDHAILLNKMYHYFGIRVDSTAINEKLFDNQNAGHQTSILQITTGKYYKWSSTKFISKALLFLMYLNDLPLPSQF